MKSTDFVVARHDLQQCKFIETGLPDAAALPDETLLVAAWSGFAPMLDQWLEVIEGHAPLAVKQVYLDTLNGRVPPVQGHILSLAK
jgi:hypothetical protein